MSGQSNLWQRLYARVDAFWVALDVSTRGLCLELLRYADEDGFVALGSGALAGPGGVAMEIARITQAKTHERARIRRDVAQLLAPQAKRPPYLLVVEGGVRIHAAHGAVGVPAPYAVVLGGRALSSGAERQARYRARKRAQNGVPAFQGEPS